MASWKKSNKLIPAFENKLISGMLNNGYSRAFAERIFEQIKGFGEYGFPQSHAASFALLVYVSSWIKCHHPAAFAAAIINSQPMGFYQPSQLIQDAQAHGVKVLPIDVNHSAWDCTLEFSEAGKDSHAAAPVPASAPLLRLGMCLVRGLRKEEAAKIVTARPKSGYRSIVSLWRTSGTRASTLKRLAHADAFCSLSLKRQQALWEIRKLRDERLPLFEGHEEKEEQAKLPAIKDQQEVLRDYQVMRHSLKSHPIAFLRQKLQREGVITSYELKYTPHIQNGARLALSGLVLVRQRPSTASGVVFMTLEDESGMANVIIWPKVFSRYRDVVCDSVALTVSGKFQREGEVIHLIAESFRDITPLLSSLDSVSRDFH